MKKKTLYHLSVLLHKITYTLHTFTPKMDKFLKAVMEEFQTLLLPPHCDSPFYPLRLNSTDVQNFDSRCTDSNLLYPKGRQSFFRIVNKYKQITSRDIQVSNYITCPDFD